MDYRRTMEQSGELWRRRHAQQRQWMWNILKEELYDRLVASEALLTALPRLEAQVERGVISPGAAATELLHTFLENATAPPTRPM